MKTHLITVSLAAGALLFLSSCASSKHATVNHRAFEKTPDKVSSAVWRTVAKSNPLTADAAFHGRWGGSGNQGGKPVDAMDEAFRRHDIVYYESRCGEHLLAADRALVDRLKEIDPDTLDPKSRKYRETAISFMESPFANLVGKPIDVMLRSEESEDCYFHSSEIVTAFFDPAHQGFPDDLAEPAPPAPARPPEPAPVISPEPPADPLVASASTPALP